MFFHADPARCVLTAKMLAALAEMGDPPPACWVCGKLIVPGDQVDPFFPYSSAANLHATCANPAPTEEPTR